MNYDDSRPGDHIRTARAYSIAVAGNDMYVGGYQLWLSSTSGTLPMGVCWKNGFSLDRYSMSLLDSYEMNSIALAGNDVYLAGFEDGVAKYWKNGIPVILGDPANNSDAYSIFLAQR